MRLPISIMCLLAIGAGCLVPECGRRKSRADLDLRQLSSAARIFKSRTGHLPRTIAEMTPPQCSDGGCIIEELPMDPWAMPYDLQDLADGGVRMRSAGPDQKWDTEDDIARDINVESSEDADAH